MPQPLSSKESSLFRTVVRNYEDKQYKKGFKAAEQILKKNPKHGDTMAMKALILNSMGKPEEAFPLAKLALENDMKSHVCWHVYGLLYRSDKNFEEAIKAYKFALKLDPDSQQIQRDLALLQIQMRDYSGYVVSRRAMLQARSTARQNWTALAVAYHLAGNLAEAEGVLTTYEDTLRHPPSKADLENSEAVMYKNSLIAEMGDTQKALDHLDTACKHNLDRLAVLELRAKYLAKLGRKEEAVKALRSLIDRNSEHKDYYTDLAAAMEIDSSDHKALKAIYDEYAEKYPRSDSARRLPLDFLEGDDFRIAARQYIRRMLGKGVPSTFANLKHLYSDLSKKETILSLVQEYLGSETASTDGGPKANGDTSKGDSAALYFLAQHYNYHLSRDLGEAMRYVDLAIELEPKSVDFYMTKARIWKHYGNTQKASEVMEQARELDIRDRYINTKAAKYQLRNNQNDAAVTTLGMFTRAEAIGGPIADLHDMQCIWFLTEDGEAHSRQGKLGLALKRFLSVYNVFDVWQEDQFDFHSFSLRKGQIRAYVDMIRWEDHLREHPFFTRAALAAIKIYIKLHDRPLSNGTNGTAHGGGDDAIERRKAEKKAAQKARKEAQKLERDAAAKKAEPNKPTKEGGTAGKKVDEDPEGLKLAATTEPMQDALKFLTYLLDFSPKSIDAQLTGFEVFIRKKKYLLALQCLLAASKLDMNHPTVHEQSIRFKLAADAALSSLPPKTAEVIKTEFTLIPESKTISDMNEDFLSKNNKSIRHIYSFHRVRRLLPAFDQTKHEAEILSTLSHLDVTLDEATEGIELLSSWNANTETYRAQARSKWPEASILEARPQ